MLSVAVKAARAHPSGPPLRLLRALPPYPGSKRELVPAIFALVAQIHPFQDWPGLRFLDAFFGGGSVGLSAKAHGFGTVIANDIAEHSAIVGRALLANSRHRLDAATVLRLFQPIPPPSLPAPAILSRIAQPQREFFEGAWRHLVGGTFGDLDRDMVATLVIRALLRLFPMGLPMASDAPAVVAGEFDRVTSSRLAHYLGRGRALVQPAAILQAVEAINEAVIPGNAVMHRGDAMEFLQEVEGDVVYLDAPYGGTQSYERAFGQLDEYLGAEAPARSEFSSRRPPLDELLDACRRIPTLVFSMNNSLFDEEGISELIERHRHVERFLSIPYRHYGAVATSAKNATNREFLVLATLRGRS